MISTFLTALGSEGPPADRAKEMDLYGWLIGSWEMDTVRHLDDGTIQKWTEKFISAGCSTEITANGFHWIGEERSSESDPWQIAYEHFAHRTNP